MPDDNSPVTRAEFRTELRAGLDNAVELVISEIRALEGRAEERAQERERALETKLLAAFYDWARSNQALLAQARADHAEYQAGQRIVDARVTALESRLLRVEERLALPPLPPDEAAPGQPS